MASRFVSLLLEARGCTPIPTTNHLLRPRQPPLSKITEVTPSLLLLTHAIRTYFTISSTAFDSLPLPTREVIYPNLGWVPSYGNGTREDCQVYMTPPIMINNTIDYSCQLTAEAYRVSPEDFISWNPALQNLTTECLLSADEQYCAQLKRVEPAGGVTSYCIGHQVAEQSTVDYGDCDAYLATFGVDEQSFKEWNGVDCDSFETGYSYCASVRHFRPAGESWQIAFPEEIKTKNFSFCRANCNMQLLGYSQHNRFATPFP